MAKKPQRPSEDNVIYANFGARRRVSTAMETSPAHLPADSERGDTGPSAPSGRGKLNDPAWRLYSAMVRRSDPARRQRGKSYADKGNVLSTAIQPGRIVGAVAGTQNEPFTTMVVLPYRETKQIYSAVDLMASTDNSVSDARAGIFSTELLDLLFAAEHEPVRFMCTCPDSANTQVCKHGVAVAIKATEMLDDDPTALFRLRNLDLNTLERQIVDSAGKRAHEAVKEGSEFFWAGRSMPPLPDPKVAPMLADSDLELLHKAIQTISYTNIEQLRGVADIEDLYHELTRR